MKRKKIGPVMLKLNPNPANERVDAHRLYMVEEPNTLERLALELASAIQASRDPSYVSVSWESQVEACAYLNEHGLEATLDRLHELGG